MTTLAPLIPDSVGPRWIHDEIEQPGDALGTARGGWADEPEAPAAPAPGARARSMFEIFGNPPHAIQLQIAQANAARPQPSPTPSPSTHPVGATSTLPKNVAQGTVPDPPVGSVFVGLKLGAQKNDALTVPGTNHTLDLKGWGAGLGVYFPGPKTAFVSSTGSFPAPLVGKALGTLGQLKVVGAYNFNTNTWQGGLGVTEMHKGWGYFYNGRISTSDVMNAQKASLASPGKEIPVGTLNAGIIQSPRCDKPVPQGPLQLSTRNDPGSLSRLATGVGFQARLVAKDGQFMVNLGKQGLMPLAAWEASLAAASQFLSNRDAVTCNNDGSPFRQVQNAWGAVESTVRGMLAPDKLLDYGAAAAGLTWTLIQGAGGLLRPAMNP
ncbi:MAG: hypothetical protein WCK28_10740 [Burkholderiales bacterium]|jgi:hypothetical protein